MKKESEKCEIVEFNVNDILPTVLILGISTLGTALVLQLLGDTRDDMTTNSAEYNATVEGIEGVSKFPEKMGMIASAVVFGILIGILVRYLMVRMS